MDADKLQLMCTNQLTPQQRKNAHLLGAPVFDGGHGFGCGVAVVTDPYCGLSIPCGGPMGAVGWPGGYGGWWRADKKEQIVKIFLTHSMAHPAQLARGIGFGVYEAIDRFAERGV